MTPILKTCLSLILASNQQALHVPDVVQKLVKSRIQNQWASQQKNLELVWDSPSCTETQNYSWTGSDIQFLGASYPITEILDGRTLTLPNLNASAIQESNTDPSQTTTVRKSRSRFWIVALSGLAVGGLVALGAKINNANSRQPISPTGQSAPQQSPNTSSSSSTGPTVSTGVAF